MQATNVRALKKNPSQALRMARETGPVLILKGDEPDALLVHLGESLAAAESEIRPALAASLYREGYLSLGRAARVSGLSLSDFVSHLGSLGIDVVRPDGTDAPRSGRRLRTGASRSTDACARFPADPLLGPRHSNGGLPYRSPPAVERGSAGLPGARRPGVHRRGVRSRGYMKRGEIWTVSGAGHAGKPRPAVIVQDGRFDATASVTICVFTSNETDAPLLRLPVAASESNGLRTVSRMMVDKITTVSRARLGERIGRLDEPEMVRLERALLVFFGLA